MKKTVSLLGFILTLTGCQFIGVKDKQEEALETVSYVDLKRFMGDWYVIAAIPTPIERTAFNAVESYRLNDDGSIATIYTFRKGGFDGKQKRYTPTGFILDDDSNAVWGMRFIWPFKLDYRVIYLTPDYRHTIIGRNKRDFVWIMSREPSVNASNFNAMVDVIESVGYDSGHLRLVPQKW
jgi:apolipoprotein D and lipocalin family protein